MDGGKKIWVLESEFGDEEEEIEAEEDELEHD
jgi:hypothetical protein